MVIVTPHELLERDAELEAIEVGLTQAQKGEGRVLMIEGPAGIGKSRLLQEARERAAVADMPILGARGSELERDFPFSIVRQLLEPAVAGADSTRRAELLSGWASAAAQVLGVGGDAPERDASTDPSFASLNGLYWLLANLVDGCPTLTIIDDAHWADPASLRFLNFLLPRLGELPVLMVVAARPGHHDSSLANLAADPGTTLLRPRALSRDAVAGLVRDTLTRAAAEEYCAACLDVTGGNPFLLRELLGQLAAEGSSGAASDVGRVRQVVPATISHAVLVRLSRLTEEVRRLARAASVLGDGTELRTTARLAGLDHDVAADAADALATAGVLEPGRPLRFAHPLIRAAIYEELPTRARVDHHARAAELLRSEGAEPERIALHLVATEPRGDQEVASALSTAARRALDRAAPEAASTYLKRALREPPADAVREDLIAMLVTAAVRSGSPTAFDDIGFDLVSDALAHPSNATKIAGELTVWLYADGRRDDASRLLAQCATSAAEAGDHDLALQLAAQRVVVNQLPLSEIATFTQNLVSGGPGERLFLAMEAYASALRGGPASTSSDLARRALQGGRIFSEQRASPAPYGAISVLMNADELDEAEDAIALVAEEADRQGVLLRIVLSTAFRGRVAMLRGDVSASEADCRVAVELLRRHDAPLAFPPVLSWLMDSLIERDEAQCALRELHESGLPGDIPSGPWLNDVLFQRGRADIALGRLDAGLADVLRARERERAAGRLNPAETSWAQVAAAALVVQGETRQARALAEHALERARAWGTPRMIGTALRVLGLVEGGRGGLELLQESARVLERSPSRLELARTLTDLGAALRRANRRAAAREPLRAALDGASRVGALALARRAHEELTATGERLRPLFVTGVESLTPSERRIAEQAAAGRSNKEIAQAMFLTVKTVESHLTNAYRKLDVESRRELPAALGTEQQ